MKKSITLLTLIGIAIALSAIAPAQQKKIYPDRWVYAGANVPTDKDADALIDLIHTAAAHGLNGIVLSGVDRISTFSPEELARLTKVKEAADANHIEIIPSGFNTGYGGAILMHDKNLAEGLLVEDALFVAKDGSAQFVADSPAKLVNGGFEEYKGNRFTGFTIQDEPGKKTFVDTTRLSLRQGFAAHRKLCRTTNLDTGKRRRATGYCRVGKPAHGGSGASGPGDSCKAEPLLSRQRVGQDRRCRAGRAIQHQVVYARRARPQPLRATRSFAHLRLEKGDHRV